MPMLLALSGYLLNQNGIQATQVFLSRSVVLKANRDFRILIRGVSCSMP